MLEFCLRALAIAVVAYFCGCFNGAVIVSKYILRDDVRTHGSGNAGLTNFYRTFGGPLTAVVILLDVVKMVVAVLFGVFMATHLSAAGQVLGPDFSTALADTLNGEGTVLGLVNMLNGSTYNYVVLAKYWAGLWCILGHMYPCMFHFKGGKGVLSGGTLAIMVDWRVALVVWGGFIVLAALTRYVSLGSVWAGFTFPFATGFVFRDPILVVLALIPGWLLVWKHRGNIKRLLNGTESKFSFHPKRDNT